MKTIAEIFAALDAFNAEVTIYRSNYRHTSPEDRWMCSIHLESEGVDLKIRKNAAQWDDALHAAFANFETLTASREVNSVLNLPLLSAPEAI